MSFPVRTTAIPWLLGTVGGLALAAQTLMLRELMVVTWGNELVFGIGLSGWLIGVGLGAALATRRVRREQRNLAPFMAGILALPVCAVAGLTLVTLLPVISGTPTGVIPGFGPVLLVAGPAFLTAAFPVGWTFPLGTSLTDSDGERIPTLLYAVEAAGSLAAGLALAFLLLGRMSSGAILVVFTVPLLGSAWALVPAAKPRFVLVSLMVATAAVALGTDGVRSRIVWQRTHAGERVWEQDTPYQRLALGRMTGQSVLLSNGKPVLGFPDPTEAQVLAGHLLAQWPTARQGAILGVVQPGTVARLAEAGVTVTWVMVDGRLARTMEGALPPPARSHVRIVTADPRAWIRSQDPSVARYDWVYLAGTEPVSVQAARLTTVNAFRELAAMLPDDGMVAFSIPSAVNYLAGDTGQVAATELAAVRAVFPYLAVSPESPHRVFACRQPGIVTDHPEEIRRRLTGRDGNWRRVALFVSAAFPPERVRTMRDWMARLAPMDHLDDRPILVLRYERLLGWYSGSGLGPLLSVLERLPWIWVVLPLFLLGLRLAGSRNRFPTSPTGMTGVAGMASMAIALVLLTAFQVRVGTLFQQVALINGCFMAGLPIGALFMERRGRESTGHPMLGPLTALLLLAVLLAVLGPAGNLPPVGFYLASAGAGLATGAVFPAALLAARGEHTSGAVRAGRVDAADHLGAAVGALLSGAFMVPAIGFTGTLLVVVAMLGVVLPVAAGQGSASGLHSPTEQGGGR